MNFGEELTNEIGQNLANEGNLVNAHKNRSWELAAAAIFVAVHLLAPVVLGEMYPFTISPMFCDQPTECCTYQITDSAGESVDAALFNLHLVYDGNPPGLGMGIVARETLHPYCAPCDEAEVTRHMRAIMKRENIQGPLTVRRRHLAPQDNKIVETISQWQVANEPAAEDARRDQRDRPDQRDQGQAAEGIQP